MHARSGGVWEIVRRFKLRTAADDCRWARHNRLAKFADRAGMMQGKIDGDTFVVMDAFALPVIGTETRVNAGKCVRLSAAPG